MRVFKLQWDSIVRVLILILMEYALWAMMQVSKLLDKLVLILILMEYALWAW